MGLRNTFGTVIKDVGLNNRVYVESLNGFPAPVGDTITLVAGTNYLITRPFVLGGLRFLIPTGAQIEFNGTSELLEPIISILTTGALWNGDLQRLTIREVDFINVATIAEANAVLAFEVDPLVDCPPTGAAFWGIVTALTPSPTVLFRRNFVIGFAQIGTLSGVFYICNNSVYVNCGDTLHLRNPNNRRAAVLIEDQQHDTQAGTHVAIYDQQRFFSIQNLVGEPDEGDSLLHLDSSITLPSPENVPGGGTGLITDCGFSDVNGGTFLTATSIKQDDKRFIFDNNYRSINSYSAGAMGFADNTVDTVIAVVDTYVDIAGVIAADSDNERFSFLSGVLTYVGLEPRKFKLSVDISLKKSLGASARTVRGALFADTGSGFVEVASAPLDMDNNIKSFGFAGIIELNTGDDLKVMIKNETNTDDILIVTYNFVVTEA